MKTAASKRFGLLKLPKRTVELVKYYLLFGYVCCRASFLENLLTASLNLKLASNFRWLDCYLVGHFTSGNRIPETSRYGADQLSANESLDHPVVPKKHRLQDSPSMPRVPHDGLYSRARDENFAAVGEQARGQWRGRGGAGRAKTSTRCQEAHD